MQGLEHLITCSVGSEENSIEWRVWKVTLKRVPGSKIPNVELQEMGPRMSLVLRRNNYAPQDLLREALKTRPPKDTRIQDFLVSIGKKPEKTQVPSSKPKGIHRDM